MSKPMVFQKEKSSRTIQSPRRRGAADRDRTGTSFTSRDFKSRASASSATAANEFALQINIIPLFM